MAIVQKSILSCLNLIIVFVLLLLPSTYTDAKAQKAESKVRKIVIDAGHGGKDPGACGLVYQEKNIVLGVALRLGKLIEDNMPDVEIIYTRNKDVFIELYERADIANKAEADLFVSIHTNAVKDAQKDRDVNGFETWVMGVDKLSRNMEVVMRENAVVQYEDNYKENYGKMLDPNLPESDILFSLMQASFLEKSIKVAEFIQSELKSTNTTVADRGIKQGPFLVLWRTATPSVLVEIGFISNIAEEQLMGEVVGQQDIAESLYKAIEKYRNYLDGVTNDNLMQNDAPMLFDMQNDVAEEKQPEVSKTDNNQQNQPTQNKTYKWITDN